MSMSLYNLSMTGSYDMCMAQPGLAVYQLNTLRKAIIPQYN